MTFKELAEDYLKDNSEGIWVHFNTNFDSERNERYLDEEYLTEFADVLENEVKKYYTDECGYEVLEVFLNDD